jgi:hypothetical protein
MDEVQGSGFRGQSLSKNVDETANCSTGAAGILIDILKHGICV